MGNSKTSVLGKVLSIIFGILALIMIFGNWIDIHQMPNILKNYAEHKYSIFELEDFMSTFNRYLEDNTIEFYTYILYIGTYVVIIITILTMIMTLLNAEPTVRIANGSVCFSAVLIVTSLLFVYEINSYVDEATYGGIDELLRLTAGPFLLLLFSILQKSCLLITEQQLFSNITSYRHINLVQKQCPSCGAFIQNGAMFCDKCGARAETETPKPAIIYCTNCGQPIPYGTAFCTNCGQNVNNTI